VRQGWREAVGKTCSTGEHRIRRLGP
jgi:hypothetical protein